MDWLSDYHCTNEQCAGTNRSLAESHQFMSTVANTEGHFRKVVVEMPNQKLLLFVASEK